MVKQVSVCANQDTVVECVTDAMLVSSDTHIVLVNIFWANMNEYFPANEYLSNC